MNDGAPAGRIEAAGTGGPASPPSARRRASGVGFAAVFLVVLVVHFASPFRYSFDSRWVVPSAMSLVAEGNTDLDEYRDIIKPGDYRVEKIGGRLYSIFPIGTTLIAVPFVAAADAYYRLTQGHGYESVLQREEPLQMESFISSFCVALAAALLYLVAMERLGCPGKSLLIVFVFAFCTSAWSTASRSLWQHAPSMLMLTGTLYLFVLAEKKPKLIQYAGLLLAFAYVVRPTNSISIAALTVLVLVRHRKYFLHYLGWAAVIAVPFFAFNYSTYGTLLPGYFGAQRIGTNAHFWEALAGNMVSPARGLFIFSPVLLLSLAGVWIKAREKRLDGLDVGLLAVIVLHWAAVSSYIQWWGGHCYGPRYMSDMLPYFAYFLVPVVEKLARPVTWRVAALATILVVLAAGSFVVHYRGATTWYGMAWNAFPIGIDEHPERAWDWHDLQFMRTQ